MSRFVGKLVMVLLAGYLQVPILGVLLFLVIGHLFDVGYPTVKQKIEDKYRSQRSSEKIIFLYAYYTYFLGVDAQTSLKSLLNNVSFANADHDAISSLFLFYNQKYIPNQLKTKAGEKKINRRLELSIALLTRDITYEDVFLFINLLEKALYAQDYPVSDEQWDMQAKICRMLGVEYMFKQTYQQEFNEEFQQTSRTYQQKDKSEHQEETQEQYYEQQSHNSYEHYDYISAEVKAAFSAFNLQASKDHNFDDIKKVYKLNVKKYHPDILKGQGASDIELERADDKLAELNKSIDIIKKFLANE